MISRPLKALPALTLKALFDYSVENYPERPALGLVCGEMITYAQFSHQVAEIQELLISNGIRRGDKVALYSENMPNWAIAYFAVTAMGAVIVPVLPDFHPSEALHIATHAECKAAFISKKLIEALLDEAHPPELTLVVETDTLAVLADLSSPDRVGLALQKGEKHLKSALGRLGRPSENEPVGEEDLAAIIYTSGTTGSSKGVMLTHKNLAFEVVAAQHIVEIHPEDRFLSILPLAHTYECTIGLLIPIFNGSSVFYLSKPPTPTILIKALSSVKPTFMLSVPLIIEKIYKNRILPNFHKNMLVRTLYAIAPVRKMLNKIAGKKLMETFGGELRFFGIGGAALSPTVEAFLREAGFPYCIGYGLTETAPLLAGTDPSKTKYRAIGPALEGVELELRDMNEEGEGILWARGPNVMMGYYKDPEKTAAVMDEAGWFNTEDIGYFDKDGYFFMSGRSKNIIVGPGGENIYPEQIEAAINAHELVADALVYDYNGTLTARINLDYEKLDAFFGVSQTSETKVHAKIDEILEEIRNEVNAKLSSFSRVRKVIEQREPFVKTPTKKIKRYLYVEAQKQ